MKEINRAILLILFMSIMFMLIGCGTEINSESNEKEHMNNYAEIISNKVVAVSGKDIIDKMYDNALSFNLSLGEVENLKDVVKEARIVDGKSGSKPFYRLVLIEKENEVFDEWIVDMARNITTSEGLIHTEGDFKKWIDTIEENHRITYETVLEKKPGENYFFMLEKAYSAELYEITETNFDEGIEYNLSNEEVAALCSLSESITVISETQNFENDLKYRVVVFDENEAELYTFDVDKRGTISCNGWEIGGDGLMSFMEYLLKKQAWNSLWKW